MKQKKGIFLEPTPMTENVKEVRTKARGLKEIKKGVAVRKKRKTKKKDKPE